MCGWRGYTADVGRWGYDISGYQRCAQVVRRERGVCGWRGNGASKSCSVRAAELRDGTIRELSA